MALLMGVDVGSSSCKVTVVDERGAVVASSSRAYPTYYPKPGWAEQDPEDWYHSACQAMSACLASGNVDSKDVIALAVDGPAHSAALMDDAGNAIRPTIHTVDTRSMPQSEWLQSQYGERIFQISYQQISPSWTLTHLLWLKQNEPDIWSKLRRILVVKDYVRYRFTGDYQTDVYDAIGTQLYDVGNDRWSQEICDILGFPVSWLPPVLPANAVSGKLLPDVARQVGLPAGIPVAVGSGDSVVEAFGVGVVDPGQCVVKLATFANVNLVTALARPMPKVITYRHVVDGRWFAIAANNAGTWSQNWLRDALCRHEVEQAKAQDVNVFDLIGALAASAPPGCEGLLFHPYLRGERTPYWDPRLRADFVGIQARHELKHFARAVLEGVGFSMRDCMHAIEELGQPVVECRLIGGGARSRLWAQILCDVLGKPLLKPPIEDAALGSALLAGVAIGVFPDWQSAVKQCVQVAETLHPDPKVHMLYNEYFDVYRAVVRDLAVHSHRLADLASRKVT